jgi:translation initiation factor IF-2
VPNETPAKKKKIRRVVIDQPQSSSAKKQTSQSSRPPQKRRRRGGRGGRKSFEEQAKEASRKKAEREADRVDGVMRIPAGSSPKELAEYWEVTTTDVIRKLLEMGETTTVNQSLGEETIILLAEEFNEKVEIQSLADELAEDQEIDISEEAIVRPPVVTIMGHVDHGKTSLLDAIRETEVAESEAGGITQHIGAYRAHHDEKTITFIDTPGHEAFTAMRARGADITDVVVLVVAADDGVQPQTEEAISHAKAVGVPIIVAVNKIDKPGADPQKVRTELASFGISPEEWGGENLFVDVSAKQRQNIGDLLETILLVSEVEELRADPDAEEMRGTVIESKLDIGRGPVATVIVENGTLCVGDSLLCGAHAARVRSMLDEHGHKIDKAKPGTPVVVLGFDSVPQAGERVQQMSSEKARRLAQDRAQRLHAETLARRHKRVTLESFAKAHAALGQVELTVIVKSDTRGSNEAIEDELVKLPQEEIKVNLIHSGVGGVTESDVMLAAASDAIVLAFNVRAVGEAEQVASREDVEIRYYSVIYRILEDLRQAMQGLLKPKEVEKVTGRAEVLQLFKASNIGTIAGSIIRKGKIARSDQCRIIRDGTVIYSGKIQSLRRGKDDARQVQENVECGITVENYQDIKVGDTIEAYTIETVERKLG